jgi:hypothetical protein
MEGVRIIAIVETKVKLRQIQREIFLADIMIRPDDPALEQCPEAFDIVGKYFAANILALAMFLGFVMMQSPR